MDEVIKKLNFGNSSIQYRTVSKLVDKIITTKPNNQPISSTTKQIPELDLLWEKCGDSLPMVSALCSQALTSLVVSGHAEPGYVINGLIGAIPSASNQIGPVSSLVDLLMNEMEGQLVKNRHYECPFSLRSPVHPLIVILRDVPSAWPAVLTKIQHVFQDDTKRVHGMKMLKPVLQYILIDPTCPSNYALLRSAVYDQIIFASSMENSNPLVSYIPWLQVRNNVEVSEVVLVAKRISEVLLNILNEDKNWMKADSLLLVLLALCHCMLQLGLDPLGILQITADIARNLKQEKHSFKSHMSLVLLSVLLEESSGVTLQNLLQIGDMLLERSGISPNVAAMLIVPILQIISDSPDMDPSNKSKNQNTAMGLVKLIEKVISLASEEGEISSFEESDILHAFTDLTSQGHLCANVALKLHNLKHPKKLEQWVDFVKMAISKGDKVPQPLFHLLAGLLLTDYKTPKLLQAILEMLQTVAKSSAEQASMVLLLLLYKIRMEPDPECQLLLLESLPMIATHTLCIPPVLSILQLMAAHPQLKSQAVHLMVSLWKQQERCFPYLQKLLTEKVNSTTASATEFFIARSAAIKEVCHLKPSQHGGELLGIISTILTESSDDATSPAAALALDGVYILCQSKVINIETTWKVLAPKLSKDKRSLVMTRLFNLLSLVPELRTPTFEYDKFMGNIAFILWRNVSCERNPLIIAAGFKALAAFPPECHLLRNLPQSAKVNLKLPPSMTSTPYEMGKQPEDVLSYTPGYCFLDLLLSIEHDIILEGYSKFFASLIHHEVKEMPRSIHHIAKRAAKPAAKIKAIAEIPGFLCSKYEMKQLVAIQGSVAVGLLLSYEPPVELDKDGQPSVRFLLRQGEFYAQVMGALIQDVSLDSNEWRRCALLSPAWASFMERAFTACEESRRKQIDMDKRHGRLPGSADDIRALLGKSWLWVRDSLMDVIKTSVKGKPSAQANGVLVLGGLVGALHRYVSALDEDAKQFSSENEYLSHQDFISMAIETILHIIDPSHRQMGDMFGWIFSHSSRASSTAPPLVRSCAAMAVCNFLPLLLSSGAEYIEHLCDVMLQQLSCDRSPVVEYFFGVGVGLYIQTLCREAYADSSPSHCVFLMKTLERLDYLCVGEDGESRVGPFVGLTLSIAACCQSGKSDLMSCAAEICEQYNDKLYEEDSSSVSFEVVCVCTTSMVCACALSNLFAVKRVEELLTWFEKRRQKSPQCGGTAASIGIIMETLQQLGHSKSFDLKESLLKQWIQTFASESQPTLSRLAALKGLCAVHSEGGGLIQIPSNVSTENLSASLSDVVRLMIQVVIKSRDVGLQNCCTWSLGELFSAKAGKQSSSAAAVSSNYSYLNDKSVLKPVINFLTKNTLPGNDLMNKHIGVCLSALNQSFPRPLPPLNWVSVLSPFLQSEQDPYLIKVCLEVALQLCSSASSAAALVESWITPPLVTTLNENSKEMLLSSLHMMIKCLPSAKLHQFIKSTVVSAFSSPQILASDGQKALKALLKSLQVVDSPQDITRVLHQTVEAVILEVLPHFSDLQHLELLPLLCECLTFLSDEVVNRITNVTNNIEHLLPLTIIKCQLIETGRRPLHTITSCIEAAENLSQSERQEVICTLWMCFIKGRSISNSDISQPEKCISWFIELMEKTKTLLDNRKQFWISTSAQVISYYLGICAAVIAGCTGLEVSFAIWPQEEITEKDLISVLPHSLPLLLSKKSWNNMVGRVLDWILLLLQSNRIPKEIRPYLEACLIAFRSWKEFSKYSFWSQAVSVCTTNHEL